MVESPGAGAVCPAPSPFDPAFAADLHQAEIAKAEGKRSAAKPQPNPKHEIRNPKQIRNGQIQKVRQTRFREEDGFLLALNAGKVFSREQDSRGQPSNAVLDIVSCMQIYLA
jgi:hypothetical protein